jgi:UDP:flavonoid glycosyltransferase YjiC (YdhE family)
VLVTLGTSVDDPTLLTKLTAIAETADVNLIITLGADADADALDVDRTRVHPVSFVPLARLLDGVDAVVSTAGTGTLLATLAAGLPMVLMPIHADQPWNAERAAQLGVAVAISDPGEAGHAVRTVLSTPSYRTEAEAIAAAISQMPTPSAALQALIERC